MTIAILLALLAAGDGVVRLTPSHYPGLPSEIRAALGDAGCTIPQLYGDAKPHNVVRGRFASARDESWAALCSRNGVSVVMVLSGSDRYELNPRPDAEFIQGIGGDRVGFSRVIEVADAKRIRAYFDYRGEKPPPLTHDGIDDIFEPKASVVHYFSDGTWHRWPGAD